MYYRLALTLATTLSAMGGPAVAQTAKEVALGKPNATHSEPFALVNTIRELSDGRVVVADPIDGTVVFLDARLASRRQVGREGQGPGEYKQPDAAWPMPGDSTLIVDLGNSRLSLLSPEGKFGRSLPMTVGRFTPGSGRPPTAVIPGGTDTQGRIYFQDRGFGQDSSRVLRVDASGTKIDTIARVRNPDVERRTSGGTNNRNVSIRPIPYSGSDGWAVANDGGVALLRLADYHVDWVSAGAGAHRSGKPLQVGRVRINTKEKEEYVTEQQLRGGIGMQVAVANGDVQMSFSRGARGNRPDISGYNWPKEKPPFLPGSPTVDARGRVWVARSLAAGEPRLYDVFGRDGHVAGSVRFPQGRRLVGFGKASLYAVAIDDDGLHTLERYPIPL